MNTVIVGAGPAGVRAAETLVRHGLRPTVVDEAPTWGGQIYRQQPAGFQRRPQDLYGFEAGRAQAVHAAMGALLPAIDYRPETLVWGTDRDQLQLLRGDQGSALPFARVLVATGATDRVLPFAGWTLPGVTTLGAAQIALKYQGCGIGPRVVFAGSGPLLYLVAYQYAKAGAQVLAVLDQSRLADKLAAVPAMLNLPGVLAKGAYYAAWLRTHGVAVHEGARLLRAEGEDAVQAVVWSDGHHEHAIACDALACAHALRSETQLADLLGCEFHFDTLQRAWLPRRDGLGRSSRPGVYLAGDGAAIGGADVAERAGELAALALLQDAGLAVDARRIGQLQTALARQRRFRQGLERAFPFPEDWAAQLPDETLVCRCEEISAGTLRDCVAQTGARELNRLKALCRVGMGRCQGRMCGAAAAEVLAQATQQPVAAVGRLRAQAPLKPLPFGMLVPTTTESPCTPR
jgi:hydrogen cyanide synthase HcnB